MTINPDRGSATVEFVGVGLLLTMCSLAILQVGVVAHVSAILTDSAVAGAAYAALADSSLTAGIVRTRELTTAGIAADLVTDVTADHQLVAGRPVAVVTVEYRIPIIGPWLPVAHATVSGRAFLERP